LHSTTCCAWRRNKQLRSLAQAALPGLPLLPLDRPWMCKDIFKGNLQSVCSCLGPLVKLEWWGHHRNISTVGRTAWEHPHPVQREPGKDWLSLLLLCLLLTDSYRISRISVRCCGNHISELKKGLGITDLHLGVSLFASNQWMQVRASGWMGYYFISSFFLTKCKNDRTLHGGGGEQPYSNAAWERLLCLDYSGTFIELSVWDQALSKCRHILWHEYLESWIFQD